MIDRARLTQIYDRERRDFVARHPRSAAAYARSDHLFGRVPMTWMNKNAGGFPIYLDRARGNRVWDIDGLEYLDFALGDTGAMAGHSPEATLTAIQHRIATQGGITTMLPTEDAEWVGAELTRRFGLPLWGFTTSASDANRAAIRMARMITGRDKVLVFNGCYHGSVEEAHVALLDGRVVLRNGIHPNAVDHARVSKVIEFNDLAALESALEPGDVACVLTEPMMTNYGMVEPEPGFLAGVRELTRRTGTLLVIDETHTFSNGPRGYTAAHGLTPDLFVIGKAVGGGIPVGLYGVSAPVAERFWRLIPKVNPALVRQSAHLGFGGTLAGSAVQVAAVRVVLERVLTETAFASMLRLAERLATGARELIQAKRLPWCVAQSGARVEIMYAPDAPRNASDVARGRNGTLEALLHVYFMNRGVLLTPFHSMMLMCPATDGQDIDRYLTVLTEFVRVLRARGAQLGSSP